MSKPLKTLVIGANWILLGMFISKLLNYVYKLIVARIGTSEYGIISLGIALMSIFVGICIIGLDRGVLRYIPFYRMRGKDSKARGSIIIALFISSIISIFVMILIFIFSKKISLIFFGNESLAYIIKILAITLPFYVIAKIFLSSMRAFKKIKYVIYSEFMLENIFKIVAALLFIYVLSFGILGAALAHLIAILTVAFFSFYFLNKYVFKLIGKIDLSVSKKIFFYSWPLMLGSLSAVLLVRVDSLMIGYLLKDATKIGIYNAAAPTAMLMLMSVHIILSLFIPVMSELLANGEYISMQKVYKNVIKWAFLINFPLFLIMIFFSKDILRILFGEAYVSGWSSLSILVGGYFLYSTLYASKTVLEVFKRTKLIMINIFGILIVGIILNYILILKYGIVGAAVATSISLLLLITLYIVEALIIGKMIPLDKSYIKLTLINLGCFFLVYKILNLILNVSLLYFILFGIIFSLLYFALLIKLKCFNEEELDFIRLFKKKISLIFVKR